MIKEKHTAADIAQFSFGNNKHFFAAANTGLGFKSYFEEIFDPKRLLHIYILKGGPGCGKSTLLKRIGKYAQGAGEDVEYFHCSSSPSSLDAVLLCKKGVAILDGTSPHAFEPRYPGVCETLVNMGECWDISSLGKNREEIISLCSKKSAHYGLAYGYLRAARCAKAEHLSLTKEALLEQKLKKYVQKLFEKEKLAFKEQALNTRLIGAFCGEGELYLDSFRSLAKKRYVLKDAHGTSEMFFDEMKNICRLRGSNAYISYDPLCPEKVNGLYFPEKSVAIIKGDAQNEDVLINTDRFLDKDRLSKNRSKRRFAEKCSQTLLLGAKEALKCASDTHEQIEKLYAPHCDFFVADRIYRELITQIF